MVPRKRVLSRRRFLTGTAAGLAAPSVIATSMAHGGVRRPASERVTAALVGCGGRGMGLLPIHDDPGCTIAAVCDVDQQHLAAAKNRIGKCDAYQDFRRILERRDIDAVLIATPDHWHAAITVMACQAGKDVYCEKPLCRTIGEGRRMVQAAPVTAAWSRWAPSTARSREAARRANGSATAGWARYTPCGSLIPAIRRTRANPLARSRPTWIGTCGWGRRRGPPTIPRGAISPSATSWTTAAEQSPTMASICSASSRGPWARTARAR